MGKTIKNMKRYLQGAGECSYCAVASVGTYYNKSLTYKNVTNILPPDGQGLYTPDIGFLLNKIGFEQVTVISADLEHLDFGWQKLSKNKLIQEFKKIKRYSKDEESKEISSSYVRFLENSNFNNLIIDMHFGDYIRGAIDDGIPVLASFNWNLFFNYPKWNEYGEPDPVKGFAEEHEVVIYGYDETGVRILDSHQEMYKGKLKKFGTGRYKIDWEVLMTVMGSGDLIIPTGYKVSNELV